MGTDLNAPLGQNRKKHQTRRFSAASVARFLFGLAFIGLIGAISIYPWVFPDPLQRATGSEPAVSAGGQSQIGSNQPNDRLAQSNRFDGANVERNVMNDGSVVQKFTPKNRNTNGPLVIDADQRQDPRLAGLPNDDLIEQTTAGDLPIVADDGLRPFDYYARPWSGARGTRIAIVVTGLGISQTGTLNAIRELPEEITLAFAANGNSLGRWVPEARRLGHEVLLQVPMEPFDYPKNNPGRGTLLTEKSDATNVANLHQAMARMHSYTGVMNYLGGRFLSSADAMEPVMRDIAARGLMFVDDGSTAQTLSGEFASALSMPHAFADVVLDNQVNESAILEKLDQLERVAYRNGSAIGVASGFDESLSAIARWAREAPGHGIEIVGVSALANESGN